MDLLYIALFYVLVANRFAAASFVFDLACLHLGARHQRLIGSVNAVEARIHGKVSWLTDALYGAFSRVVSTALVDSVRNMGFFGQMLAPNGAAPGNPGLDRQRDRAANRRANDYAPALSPQNRPKRRTVISERDGDADDSDDD